MKLFGGKVTVSAEPFFWLLVGLFGMMLGRGSPRESVMWAAVVGFSVLFHELGHAAVCLAWGKGADIVLHGFGGATRPRDLSRFGTWRTAALDLAGCAAGFGLAALALGLLYAGKGTLSPGARSLAMALVTVNVWFSIFNLLPISPMDGGKLVSGLLSARWGVSGRRVAHGIGLTLGAAACLWFYRGGALWGAFLCGAMAAGEGKALKRSLSMTAADSDETLTGELPRAVELWDKGRHEEAVAVVRALREKAKAGLTYEAATLHLAYFLYLMESFGEAYEMFKAAPEGDMSAPLKRAYADAALRKGDFALALRLGRTNFHDQTGPDTAFAAALAAAGLGDARETATWLKTAVRLGLERNALRAKEFDAVRQTEEFRELVAGLR
ncbi:MAG: site-2 protease family protein [Elusimicrobiota bacterium]|nr:site-2 protease family protein [Elusimicrobiota bacterium]